MIFIAGHSTLLVLCSAAPALAPTLPPRMRRAISAKFSDFMRRLVAVPHSEIKAQLDAEKKQRRGSLSGLASHASTSKG